MIKRILLILCLLCGSAHAALNANTVWEIRTTGAQASGGGFRWLSLVNATYKWTASGSGTNEYYCEAAAGGDPSLTEAKCATTDGTFNLDANGTMGSLTAGQWDWGDNDTLGYSTVYVRLDDGADPDSKATGYVQIGYGGGYDYSQQAAAQLSLTDLDHGAGSSTLTSATGGFTALMVGNIIHITSGTNFTAGWYEIVSYTSSNQVAVDRSLGASAGSADGVGAVGGAWLLGGTLDDEFFDARVAGNTIWIGTGSYSLPERIDSGVSGTSANPMSTFGYTSVRGDATVGTDRPLLTFASDYFRWNQFQILRNLRFSTANGEGIATGNNSVIYNCKFTATAAVIAVSLWSGSVAVSCEATSPTGTAMDLTNQQIVIANCYVHDSATGLSLSSYCTISASIIDTCTTGINSNSGGQLRILNNTVYGCTTGINGGASTSSIFANNIITGCTTGATQSSYLPGSNFWDYNCWHNTTDVSNVVKGPHDVTADPLLTDPANADFTLSAGSPCFNTGLKPSTEIGLP